MQALWKPGPLWFAAAHRAAAAFTTTSTVAPMPRSKPDTDESAQEYRTDQMTPMSRIARPGVPNVRNPNTDRIPSANPSTKACLIPNAPLSHPGR